MSLRHRAVRCVSIAFTSILTGNADECGDVCTCIGSSTRLHTRISARVILKWVSALPGETVLDCLLDDGWKQNGIVRAYTTFG